MTCKHCDRSMKKTESMKLCPMHYPKIACGVCMACYERMMGEAPPEPVPVPNGWASVEGGTVPNEPNGPYQDEYGILHGLDLHEPHDTFWQRARNDRGMRDPQLAHETHDEEERYYTRTLRRLIGSTAMVLVAALPAVPAHAAGRSAAACQPVTVGGHTVMMKPTKSGGLSTSGCGMRITLDVTDGVQGPRGFEVSGKVTDLHCTVKVTSKTLTTAGKLVEATQACVDSMHHAAEGSQK